MKRASLGTIAVVGFLAFGAGGCLDGGDAAEEVSAATTALKCGPGMVAVCHLPGGDRRKAQEIAVSQSAVAAHLKHGDVLGPCGACMRLPDGAACDDKNLCTTGDRCSDGVCRAGTPTTCGSANVCWSYACNPGTGQCDGVPGPDGRSCDDGLACTENDACHAGVCQGAAPNLISPGTTRTFHCPLESTATGGYVAPSCTFDNVLEYNNVYDGPVYLLSHLDRWFGNYDINPISSDGTIQLECVYRNAEGLQIGATSMFTTAIGGCTATEHDFVCSN